MKKPDFTLIPREPGCYLFLDECGGIIYVGKAKNLHKRVSSYFVQKEYDAKTAAMVAQIKNVDFVVTNSEVEALILENNLIKKHTPKYNIDLKDAKRYAYLEITNERFPRLVVARKTRSDGKLFGPFTSGANRDYVREVLVKAFKIRTCKRLPKKPCLRYSLGLCEAPCVGKQSEEDYMKNMKSVELSLKGKTQSLVKKLGQAMQNASNTHDFERAMKYRDQIRALKSLAEKQTMERQKTHNEDILNFLVHDETVHLMLFHVHQGILEDKQEFEFEEREHFLEEFLVQYYAESPVPGEIILPRGVDWGIKAYLETLRGKKVSVHVPQKGEKKELLDLVKKNIELQHFGDTEKLEDLQRALNLQELPLVIECFDISHLSGTATVGSMVQFRNGKPDKANYRRFKVKTVEGIDDFAALAEIVRRRYYRLVTNKEPLPNLIIIDGGAGQLHYAMEELKKLGVTLPVIALAKREEEIYIAGQKQPLKLSRKRKGLLLLIALRDEAHRFAITYNRLLRKKKLRG